MSADSTYHERDLLRRISKGDAASFTELFNKYSVKLAPYVSRLLNSDLWAEEIVQDVFLKLWAVRETLAEVENPQAYIYRMAANRTRDFLRHRSVEVKIQYWVALKTLQGSRNFTEEQFNLRISERLFREAVSHLPPQRLTAFRLRHEEGLGYDEIAKKMNISKNTVRKQLVSAMESIRAYLIDNKGAIAIFLGVCLHPFKDIFNGDGL